MSIDALIANIKKTGNPTVAGLDPKLEYIPAEIREKADKEHGADSAAAVAQSLITFNQGLIDALADIVPAVKPQAAFYEMYGAGGREALAETIRYAKEKGMYVILDAKRGDIGSTASAYAAAYLGGNRWADLEADSLTVNPYLGTDGVKPFADACRENGKSIFVLVKTSNPSSGELQDLRTEDGERIYEKMARLVNQWGAETVGGNGYSAVGAVVGATYPAQLAEMRAAMPKAYLLVPGYGAQGGTAEDVAKAFDQNGLGAIVNSSRGIMCAWQKRGLDDAAFADAAREEAMRMKEDIVRFL